MKILIPLIASLACLLIGQARAQQIDFLITGAASVASTAAGTTSYRVANYSLYLSGDLATLVGNPDLQQVSVLSGSLTVDGRTVPIDSSPLAVGVRVLDEDLSRFVVGRFGGCPLCTDVLSFTVPRVLDLSDSQASFRLDGSSVIAGLCFGVIPRSPNDSCQPTAFDAFNVAQVFSATLAVPAAAVPELPSKLMLAVGTALLVGVRIGHLRRSTVA